jgi:hypothetical protein
LEAKNKKINVIIERLLEIANYNYTEDQYRLGVDNEMEFFFEKIDNDTITGFFEGYQYQNPDVNTNKNDIINQIKIYRSQEDSQQVELITTVEDLTSQGLYGLKFKKLIVADFVDANTAIKIAQSILEFRKDPQKIIEIGNINVGTTPFTFGFYDIHNKNDFYIEKVSDFEQLSDWTINSVGTTITVIQDNVFSERNAFKIVTSANSIGDFMEIELENAVYFPEQLIFYVNQNPLGEVINIQIEDEDGNILGLSEGFLLLEDGGFLLQENGGRLLLEDLNVGIDIRIVDEYQKQVFDLTSLTNVKKIKISFITNNIFTLYFDRMEIKYKGYKYNNLVLDSIKYESSRSNILANMTFGDKVPSIVNDIKEVKDESDNILGIFEKS